MGRFLESMWGVAVLTACFGIAVMGVGCGGEGTGDSRGTRIEGTEPGDCEDGADNDTDGSFDCDDSGCAAASFCLDGGTGGSGGMGGTGGAGGLGGTGGAAGMSGSGGVAGSGGFGGADGGGGMGGAGGTAGTGGMAGTGGLNGTGGTGGVGGIAGNGGIGGTAGMGGASGTGGTGGSTGTNCDGGPLAAPIPNCAPSPLPTTGDPAQDCVDRINQLRFDCQCLPPLQRWTEGESCADQHAEYDSTRSAHSGFRDDICSPRGWAQNECPGWNSEQHIITGCLQAMWDEGPGEPYIEHGHYINMTNPSYSMVACGFYQTAGGQFWSVQNFQ